MPRKSVLNSAERKALFAVPESQQDLIRHDTLNEADLSLINQRRGDYNRLGFAVQLCYLRFPGHALPINVEPNKSLLAYTAQQLRVDPELWPQYAQRLETRREHLL
jgi:TnpA family transposase